MYYPPHSRLPTRPGEEIGAGFGRQSTVPPQQNPPGLFVEGTIATDATDGKAEEKLSLANSATARLSMGTCLVS